MNLPDQSVSITSMVVREDLHALAPTVTSSYVLSSYLWCPARFLYHIRLSPTQHSTLTPFCGV